MTTPNIHTYSDAIATLEDFAQSSMSSANQQQIRRYVEEAYREVVNSHDWSFLHVTGRVLLKAPQTTGTVVFDYVGGTYDRQLTLAGATWPDDVEGMCIRFNETVSDVEYRKSSTIVMLAEQMCPLADVASTTYSLFPRWYALPNDFALLDRPMDNSQSWRFGEVDTPSNILAMIHNDTTTGDIQRYAVGPALGGSYRYGSMALYVWPPSDTTEPLTFPYKRRARELVYSGRDASIDSAGTISVTAGSKTVTGSSTAFSTAMTGSILRIGTSTTIVPTGLVGSNRYGEQLSIRSSSSATEIVLDSPATATRSSVKYCVSDPIDLEVAAYDAFVACCRRNLVREKSPKIAMLYESAYQDSLKRAKWADSRTTQRRYIGSSGATLVRLADSSDREVIE